MPGFPARWQSDPPPLVPNAPERVPYPAKHLRAPAEFDLFHESLRPTVKWGVHRLLGALRHDLEGALRVADPERGVPDGLQPDARAGAGPVRGVHGHDLGAETCHDLDRVVRLLLHPNLANEALGLVRNRFLPGVLLGNHAQQQLTLDEFPASLPDPMKSPETRFLAPKSSRDDAPGKTPASAPELLPVIRFPLLFLFPQIKIAS